eukprot:1160962-Pelagomonas_calceolata.AAC.6
MSVSPDRPLSPRLSGPLTPTGLTPAHLDPSSCLDLTWTSPHLPTVRNPHLTDFSTLMCQDPHPIWAHLGSPGPHLTFCLSGPAPGRPPAP